MTGRRLATELVGIALLCVVLAGLRVVLPEPSNPLRAGRVEQLVARPGDDPDVNRHYDRPADEADYFVPLIQRMAARWPEIDLRRDTAAQKPPGYPFLMAGVAQVTGTGLGWLRAFQLMMSAAIVVALYAWVRRGRSMGAALALTGPMLASSFFLKSSSYLTTDNPTLLASTLVLLALLAERRATWHLAVVVVGATAAASFRQDALWLAVPIAAWWVLAAPARTWRTDVPEPELALGPRWLVVAAVLLPVIVVGRVVVEWGGLVPLNYLRGLRGGAGFSLTPLVYLLSVAALFTWPWLVARHGWRGALTRASGRAALAGLAAGLLLALVANSQYARVLGHWGGYLWSLAAHLPHIAGRSPVFLVLAPLGTWALATVATELAAVRPRAAIVLGAGFAGWSLACCFNPLVFHRYYEPPVLAFLLLATGVLPAAEDRGSGRRDDWPLWVVTAGQAAITVATLYLSLFAAWRR